MKARTPQHTARKFLIGGAMVGASLLGATGCSPSKGGKPLAGPGSASQPTAAAGVGSGSSAGLFGSSLAEGPALEITSPARGSYLTGARVTVRGTVAEGATVKVAGMAARVTGGAFEADVPVEAGLFTIVVEASDASGARSEKHVSVIAGETAAEDQMIAQAAALRITDTALDMIEPSIGAGIMAQKAAIRSQVLATKLKDTKLTGFDFAQATGTVDCVSGGMRFTAEISNVTLGIEAEAKILLVFTKKYRGDVKASKLTIDGTVQVAVQNGQPVVSVGQVTARADGFSVPDFANDQRAQIQQSFQQAFASAAGQNLATMLQQMVGGAAVRGSTNQSLLGKDLRTDYALEALAFDADGATASLAANVAAMTPTYGDQAPGSFVNRAALPRLVGGASGAQNVALVVQQDALNRALHAAWRAGALKMDLDQAAMDQLLPGVPTAMNTTALMMAVPQLSGVLVPGLPIELQIESQLPPVVTVPAQGQALLELGMGELRVKMNVIHPTAGPITLVEAAFAARVPATLTEQGGLVALAPAGQAELHVDAVGETMPGVESMLEAMLTQATGPAFQASLAQVKGVALPAVKGYTLSGLSFQKSESSLVVLGQATAAAKP